MLASGKHPSAFHFNQLLLHNHLHNCLQQGCLLPFPVQRLGRENRKATRHCFSVSIYCYCRMSETFSVEMIKGDQCLNWFHLGLCVTSQGASKKKWFCKDCCRD